MISYCRKKLWKTISLQKVSAKVDPGGKERYDSVYAGLLCCQKTVIMCLYMTGQDHLLNRRMIERGYVWSAGTGASV